MPHIRLATPADSDAILAIYAPYIETPITFEEEVPSAADFRARTEGILAKHPYLVAEDEAGNLLGYAYAHDLRERIAYQWCNELSVYLAPRAKGQGLGRALYAALLDLITVQGVKAAYGVVTYPNAASDALHKGLGFELGWHQMHSGYTCGAWHDMSWYVKELAEFEDNPAAPTQFPELCAQQPELIEDILTKANTSL